jgi:2-phospho-L-lactate/phosphoenolpyruvate guanylyltransferase
MRHGRIGAVFDVHWVVVVPVKSADVAKSRLSTYAGDLRADLARAFAIDCLAATVEAPGVRETVVVTDDPMVRDMALGCVVVPDVPAAGLNAAVRHGAEIAGARHPDLGVALLAADLPALRSVELARALTRAGIHPRALVTDRHGTGTNLLTTATGLAVLARFEGASAAAHRATGAVDLDEPLPTVRTDVDTPDDLRAAMRLGVGPATRAVLERHGRPAAR